MFRLRCHSGKRPSRAGLRWPTATLASSATDVEMASQPRRRLFADGLHGAEGSGPVDDGENAALLNDKIFQAEGAEYCHVPIAGSVYRVLAFGTAHHCGWDADAWLQNFLIYIIFVQILAPPLMLSYAIRHVDWSKSHFEFDFKARCQELGVEGFLVISLGYLFLIPFLANLAVFCKKNTEDYVRLRAVSLYLTEQGGFWASMCSLTLGCVVHCLITPMIMVVTWYLTATSSSPIDITMNMLGLTFVVGMDRLAADFADVLGYYNWDDQKTGDFVYDTLKDKNIHVGDQEYHIDSPDDLSQYPRPWWCCVSNVANWLLMVTILVIFLLFKVVEVQSDSEKELADLRAMVADLKAQST